VVGLDDIKVVRVSPGLPVVDLKVRAELEKASKQVPFLKRGRAEAETPSQHRKIRVPVHDWPHAVDAHHLI